MRRQRLIVAAGANEDRHPVARQGTHAMLVHACLREVMEKGAVRYRYSLVCTRIAGADSIVPPDVRVWEAYPEALFGISVRMSAEDIPALTAVRPDLNRKHARVMDLEVGVQRMRVLAAFFVPFALPREGAAAVGDCE